MSKNLLIIFTRNPELGKVKTRLAKTIGNENALTIYKTLLDKTAKTTSKINCDKAVYYSAKIRDNDIWDDSIFHKYLQKGEDLGVRMRNAFTEAFNSNYNKVVIIGTDLYHLDPDHLKEAFHSLDSHDVVIGPAQDGGYYLLGMKSLNSKVFKHKKWGTSNVLQETLNDLQDQSIHFLETLNDIDVYDDIINIEAFKKYLI